MKPHRRLVLGLVAALLKLIYGGSMLYVASVGLLALSEGWSIWLRAGLLAVLLLIARLLPTPKAGGATRREHPHLIDGRGSVAEQPIDLSLPPRPRHDHSGPMGALVCPTCNPDEGDLR